MDAFQLGHPLTLRFCQRCGRVVEVVEEIIAVFCARALVVLWPFWEVDHKAVRQDSGVRELAHCDEVELFRPLKLDLRNMWC